jgi:integrase
MASVRQKGDGWQMIWWVYEVDGERRQRTRQFAGSSKKAALKEARRLEEEAQALDADAGNETVAAFLKDWLAVHQNKVSPRTIDRYCELVDLIAPYIGKRRLQDLRPLDLERMYSRLLASGGKNSRPLSAQTVHHVHAAVRKAFRDGVRWGKLLRAPTDGCDPPKVERKTPVVSTPADLQALLGAFDDPDLATILELAALTGARRQEILALEWGDVDLDGARLTVSKAVEESKRGVRVKETKSAAGARMIHLPQRAVATLRAHRKQQLKLRMQLGGEWFCGELVFPSYETGGVRRPRNVTKGVARARRRAGITGGTLHGFRHGHATELLRAGVAPKVAQTRLGHSTVAVTMNIYSHVLPSMDRDAAEKIEHVFAVDPTEKKQAK